MTRTDRYQCNMSCDVLHMSAGRHSHTNDRVVNKQKLISKPRRRLVGGEEAEIVCKAWWVQGTGTAGEHCDRRKKEKRTKFCIHDFLNFSSDSCMRHETHVSVSFLSFLFLCIFLRLFVFLLSEPNRSQPSAQ